MAMTQRCRQATDPGHAAKQKRPAICWPWDLRKLEYSAGTKGIGDVLFIFLTTHVHDNDNGGIA